MFTFEAKSLLCFVDHRTIESNSQIVYHDFKILAEFPSDKTYIGSDIFLLKMFLNIISKINAFILTLEFIVFVY